MRSGKIALSNTHFSTHYIWFVIKSTQFAKSYESHIHLMRPIWILINQNECVGKCVLNSTPSVP